MAPAYIPGVRAHGTIPSTTVSATVGSARAIVRQASTTARMKSGGGRRGAVQRQAAHASRVAGAHLHRHRRAQRDPRDVGRLAAERAEQSGGPSPTTGRSTEMQRKRSAYAGTWKAQHERSAARQGISSRDSPAPSASWWMRPRRPRRRAPGPQAGSAAIAAAASMQLASERFSQACEIPRTTARSPARRATSPPSVSSRTSPSTTALSSSVSVRCQSGPGPAVAGGRELHDPEERAVGPGAIANVDGTRVVAGRPVVGRRARRRPQVGETEGGRHRGKGHDVGGGAVEGDRRRAGGVGAGHDPPHRPDARRPRCARRQPAIDGEPTRQGWRGRAARGPVHGFRRRGGRC